MLQPHKPQFDGSTDAGPLFSERTWEVLDSFHGRMLRIEIIRNTCKETDPTVVLTIYSISGLAIASFDKRRVGAATMTFRYRTSTIQSIDKHYYADIV